MPRPLYTPQEDRMIIEASATEIGTLAERLGRKRQNIINRRNKLLRGQAVLRELPPPPSRYTLDVLVGRPEWFDEDIDTLYTRLRAGR